MLLTDVIIPAFNEADSIQKVIGDIPHNLVREIIVVDNNSTDNTSIQALRTNAKVIREPRRGYGQACLRGIEYIKSKESKPDIVVFLDADYSDHPEDMHRLISPIEMDNYDLVIGSRMTGKRERGSMLPQQYLGNLLATFLLKSLYRSAFTDLGPFRAIRFGKLLELNMQDINYGWTVEMQIKAIKKKLRYTEVPVRYRKRIGTSKIAGTIKGTTMAGYKIIHTILRYI